MSRPSDALEARAATDEALRNLLLGLGAVALVVGGVGITNVMVISVLERRGEIGVRRALGARRRAHRRPVPRRGGGARRARRRRRRRPRRGRHRALRPQPGLARRRARRRPRRAAPATALAVGLLAGVSPAIRAARLDPADALRPCLTALSCRPAKRPQPPVIAGYPLRRDTRPLRIAVAIAALVLAGLGATAATAATSSTTRRRPRR